MVAKVIVSGSVNGKFPDLFRRISALHLKNNFNLALVLGDLFAARGTTETTAEQQQQQQQSIRELLDGRIKVPLPTYFSYWRNPIPDEVKERLRGGSGEVCENLFYLDKFSTTKTTEGINIVNVAGTRKELEEELTWKTNVQSERLYSSKDFGEFYERRDLKDSILITNDWPEDLNRTMSDEQSMVEENSYHQTKEYNGLLMHLRPRYHFVPGLTRFYEHPAYVWRGGGSRQPQGAVGRPRKTPVKAVTRFIAMAPFDQPPSPPPAEPTPSIETTATAAPAARNTKSLYAFTIDPSVPADIPLKPSANPYPGSGAVSFKPVKLPSSGQDPGPGNSRPHKKPFIARQLDPTECFFCMSSEKFNARLVVSIGDESYVSLAKGPLLTSRTEPSSSPSSAAALADNTHLPPSQLQIITLAHVPSLQTSSPDPSTAAQASTTSAEMDRYEAALRQYVTANFGPDHGAVSFELSRPRAVHFHRQFLVIPANKIRNALVEAAFKVAAADQMMPAFEPYDPAAEQPAASFRFSVWAPPAESEGGAAYERRFVMALESVRLMDAVFPRMVLARLLGLEERTRWQNCIQSEEVEEAEANRFRDAFRESDFSLAEIEEDNEGVKAEDGGEKVVLAS